MFKIKNVLWNWPLDLGHNKIQIVFQITALMLLKLILCLTTEGVSAAEPQRTRRQENNDRKQITQNLHSQYKDT